MSKTPAERGVEQAENEIVGTWALFGLLAGLTVVGVIVQAFQPAPGSSLWVSVLKGAFGLVGLGGLSNTCFFVAVGEANCCWGKRGNSPTSDKQ